MNIYEHIYGESRLRDKIFDCILQTSVLLLRDERMLCLDEQLFKLGDHKKTPLLDAKRHDIVKHLTS